MTEKNEAAKAEAENIASTEKEGGTDSSLGKVGEGGKFAKPFADKIRKRIVELRDAIGKNYWEMAELLNKVFEQKLYKQYGYETFNEWSDADIKIGYRKGRYLATIYAWAMRQPVEIQEGVKEIGWPRAKELVGIEGEKVKPLIEKAKELSARDFTDHMKKYRHEQDVGGPVQTELLHTFTFKIPIIERENIEHALDIAQNMTEGSRSTALAHISLEFMSAYTVQEGKKVDITDFFARCERNLGVSIVVFNKKDGGFAYGAETVQEMMGKAASDDAGKEQ